MKHTMNLTQMAQEAHAANIKWWQDINTGEPIERNRGELLMLVVTELAEAVEGIRKGLMDDKLPHRKMEEVEMADAMIRLGDYAGAYEVVFDKRYNSIGQTKHDNKLEWILKITKMIVSIHGALIDSKLAHDFYVHISMQMIQTYCAHHGLDLEGAYREKMDYNRTRADHTHEARRAEGGKKL